MSRYHQSVVPDLHETLRKYMREEAPDEDLGHKLGRFAMAGVETDLLRIDAEQARIGECDAMYGLLASGKAQQGLFVAQALLLAERDAKTPPRARKELLAEESESAADADEEVDLEDATEEDGEALAERILRLCDIDITRCPACSQLLRLIANSDVRFLDGRDLSRLEVAMDDVFGVGGGERQRDLACTADGHIHGELTALSPQPFVQRIPVEVFHNDIGAAIFELSELVNIDETAVLDDVDGARFVQKALYDDGVRGKLRIENFDGDAALDLLVDRFVDTSHPALADEAGDLIGTDLLDFCSHFAPWAGMMGAADRAAAPGPAVDYT